MKLRLGLLCIFISFLGTLYFRKYNGTEIPSPTLWLLAFILLGLLGAWLIYQSLKRSIGIVESSAKSRIDELKSRSEIIELNFDFCEFKSTSYSHQVADPNLKSIDIITPGWVNPSELTTITEHVAQSYLIYQHDSGNNIEKYISQSFPFDPMVLKIHVLNGYLKLYVDRFDRTKYYFDLLKSYT